MIQGVPDTGWVAIGANLRIGTCFAY